MARISSYPVVTPKTIDTLIISQGYDIDADNPIEGNPTGSVTIGSVIDLVNTGLVPGTGTVTSLGVSMPSAFTVSNSPVTSTGVINITGSGTSTQYIDGTGSLQLSPNQSLNTTDNVAFNSIAGDGALVTNIDKYTTSYIDSNIYTKTEADGLFSSGFVGAISPTSSAPTQNGLYSCTQSGTYTNFGGEVVSLSNQVVSIAVEGAQNNVFSQIITPTGIIFDSVPTLGSTNAVESNGIATALNTLEGVNLFPFQPNASSTELDQLKNFVVEVDFSNYTDYDPALYYAFAVINKSVSSLELKLYESVGESSGTQVIVDTFETSSYSSTSKNALILTSNTYKLKASVIPNNLIDGNYSGIRWNEAGFDERVFFQDNLTSFLKVENQTEIESINDKVPLSFGNDWYDPNFYHPISNGSTVDPLKNNFAFIKYGAKARSIHPYLLNDEQTLRLKFHDGNNWEPAFSLNYLQSLKYNVGEEFKVGMWIKYPNASEVNPIRLFLKGNYSTSNDFTITNSNWNWYEMIDTRTVSTDSFQDFQLGVRDGLTSDYWYIKGLTLTNVTKTTWKGELKSESIESAFEKDILNQNPYSRFIHDYSPFYDSIAEVYSSPFTKSIIQVTSPIESDAIQLVATNTGRFRVSIYNNLVNLNWTDSLMLPQITKKQSFKIGQWVKAIGDADSFTAQYNYDAFNTAEVANVYTFPMGEWHWVENIVYNVDESTPKILNENATVQLDCTPNSGTATFQTCGLTITLNDNPLGFRSQHIDNVATKKRMYNKVFSALGTSITNGFFWHVVVNRYVGAKFNNLGIQGSTMKAMSGDDAGDGMAEQTRIDTIPTDTDFLFIEAGANDFNTSTIGSITDAADSSTSASYYGAWKSCLDKAAVRVPNATIVILDCFRRENEMTVAGGAGSYMSAYRTANKEIAEFYGYPFIPFNNLNVTDSNITDYLVDYVHPRPVYVQLVGSEIVKEIEKISGYDYHKEH